MTAGQKGSNSCTSASTFEQLLESRVLPLCQSLRFAVQFSRENPKIRLERSRVHGCFVGKVTWTRSERVLCNNRVGTTRGIIIGCAPRSPVGSVLLTKERNKDSSDVEVTSDLDGHGLQATQSVSVFFGLHSSDSRSRGCIRRRTGGQAQPEGPQGELQPSLSTHSTSEYIRNFSHYTLFFEDPTSVFSGSADVEKTAHKRF